MNTPGPGSWPSPLSDDGVALARERIANDEFNCIRHRFRSVSTAPVGPLNGVPCAVKANIAVQGESLDAASAILAGYESPFDATVVSRLREAGAALLASTNMDEFGMGSSSERSVQGAVIHPLDSSRVVGGSSGGSAVAVAAGMVAFALGSDTGGSVRQPAGFCGVVGFKPTWGRVSRHGLVAFASSLDCIGILARRVDEVACVYEIIAGHDRKDSTSAPDGVDPISLASVGTEGLRATRIGVLPTPLDGVAPDVADAYASSIAQIEARGARPVRIDEPDPDRILACYTVLAHAEASSNLARYDGTLYGARVEADDSVASARRTRTRGFGPEVKLRILLGTWALAEGWGDRLHRRAMRARADLVDHYRTVFERVDHVLVPTSPTTAFARGARLDDPLAMRRADRFTVGPSLAGLPALAIPNGRDGEGMPCSLQIVGRAFDDSGVLRLGHLLQQEGSN